MRLVKRMTAFVTALFLSVGAFGSIEASGSSETEEATVDDGYFLSVDYDTNNPELTTGVAEGEAEHFISADENGNMYMTISPGWTNWGYKFSSPIPKNEGDYSVSFDFAGYDLSRSFYNIALSERATEKGENIYHQFGLLKIADDGNFMAAGCTTSGIKYEDDKWYHYNMIFNQISKRIHLEISDKNDPMRKAVYEGTAGGGYGSTSWGNYIPDRSYDSLKFAITGSLMVDNILVEESREKAVSFKISSEHTGNIFDKDDEKKMNIDMRNVLTDPISIKVRYIVYNEDGNMVDDGILCKTDMEKREAVSKELVMNISEYDVYDLVFDVEGENKATGEKLKFESGNFMLSVVNKLDEGEALNSMTAVNVPYIESEDLWKQFKEIMLQAGISGMRKDFTWYNVEPYDGKKGEYIKDPVQHRHFTDAVNSGIENMAILMASNPLYSETGNDWSRMSVWNVNNDEIWSAWTRYVDEVTKRHKDNVTYWEILNEPNWVMSSDIYCKIMATAYPIIKKNDPDAIVVGMCTGSMPWSWIESVLKEVGSNHGKYMDAISIHPYDFDSGEYKTKLENESWATLFRDQIYEDKITKMTELMDKYDCRIPLYITELSISSTPMISSMKAQAADLVQLYTMTEARGEVKKLFWYCLENTSIRGSLYVKENDSEGNFGLVGNQGDTVPFAAKPAYLALAGYNKMLAGAEFMDSIVEDKTRAYRFKRKDGKQVIVLWSDEGFDNIALNLGADKAEVFDIYTNSKASFSLASGIYDFTSGFEPIYIVGDFTKFERTESTIAVDNGKISAVKNDKCTFNISDKKNRNLRVEAKGTPHAQIAENTGITGGKGKIIVNTNSGAFEEEPVEVKIYDENELIYYAKYYIVIKDTGIKVSYKLGKDQTGADREVVNLSVTNETAGTELSGDVQADFTKIGGKNEIRQIVGLKPGETKTVYLNIPTTSYIKSVSATAKIDLGEEIKQEQTISVINDMEVAYNTTGRTDASVFDGEYNTIDIFAAEDELSADSFKSEFGERWGGIHDCSFKGTLLWDEEKIYILCDVWDDVFFQNETESMIWMGDGLQLGFQDAAMIGQGVGDTNTKYAEIGIAKTPKGDEVYRWSIHPSTTMTYGEFDNCDVKIERSDGRTVYKIAIPWTETIGRETVTEGEMLRFNIIANDNDGAGRRGFAVLTRGIGETKNATLFGNIRLVK